MIEQCKLPINIRENLKKFFLNDVIKTSPHIDNGKTRKNCLLILDDTTTKILDKFMGVIDLIEGGIIGIEKLKCKRKKYTQFHAIYFIEPTKESIDLVIADFLERNDLEEGEQSNVPLYDFIHLIFCSKIPEAYIQKLGKVKNLVYALISIREVNMNLQAIDENLFSLNFKKEDKIMKKKISEKEGGIISELANQALSVLTILKNFENIRLIYQKSECTEKFAHEFRAKAQKIVNKINKKKIIKNNSPVFFFVLNRGSDLLSPLLRDMSYGGMFFNVLEKIDYKIEIETEGENDKIDKEDDSKVEKVVQTSKLNEKDFIWQKYKYKPLNTAITEIQTSFQNFIQQNSEKKEDEDVLDRVQNLPQLQEFIKDFSKHLNTLKKIILKTQKSDFMHVLSYEQGIVTRKKKNGDAFDFNNIDCGKIEKEFDKIRLSLLAHFSYNQDLEKLKDTLLTEDKSRIKFKKIIKFFNLVKEKDVDFLSFAKDSKFEYYTPKVCEYLDKLVKNTFFDKNRQNKYFKKFDICPREKNSEKSDFFKKWEFKKKILDDDSDLPIIVFFFIGGISLNEVAALTNLQQNALKDYRLKLIFGGTSVHTPYSYLNKYIDTLCGDKKNIVGDEDEEDEEDEEQKKKSQKESDFDKKISNDDESEEKDDVVEMSDNESDY